MKYQLRPLTQNEQNKITDLLFFENMETVDNVLDEIENNAAYGAFEIGEETFLIVYIFSNDRTELYHWDKMCEDWRLSKHGFMEDKIKYGK